MSQPTFKAGLEDVVAGNSEICFIDGIEGRLVYRGYNVDDLANHSTFEETAYLLWHGRLPNNAELADLKAQIQAEQALPEPVLAMLRTLPRTATPMEVLRTTVSMLSHYDAEANDNSPEANLRKAVRLTARTPTAVAAWARLRAGQEPVAPQAGLGVAANFLYMLTGEQPSALHERVMDIALILHADHELNASTFAARVTVATLSDMYSGVTSAIGALKGPLHGGANEQVMLMLQEIGDLAKAEDWIGQALAAKKKIMGFGHRVYKTEDPRATHLRRLSEEVGREAGELKWFEMSRVIEQVVNREKGLYPNVDFYSASTYFMMGIPTDLFTPIFAASRMAGWTAHILEQYSNNRIIRPRAEYVGPERLTYVPIGER